MHLVFIGRTDAPAGGADLLPAGSIIRRQLDHPMIGKNDLSAVGDKKLLIDVDTEVAQLANSVRKANGSRTTPLAMTARQSGRRTPQGTSCKINFFPRMMTVCPALWPPAYRATMENLFGKDVDDLSLAFVAPLGTQDYRSLSSHELPSISCDAPFPCRLGP